MVRSDVIMGIFRYLPLEGQKHFFAAMEQSAASHALSSFQQYRQRGMTELDDMLDHCQIIAGTLGWGRWTFTRSGDGTISLQVENSPFAQGVGDSEDPVCGLICGVISAMFKVQQNQSVEVVERTCASQGGAACMFTIKPLT